MQLALLRKQFMPELFDLLQCSKMASNSVIGPSRNNSTTSVGSTLNTLSVNGDAGLKPDESFELHRAAFCGDLERIKELLESAKLDPRTPDKHGNTPLHIAVMLGHQDVISELIKHGAPVKEKNKLGWTPLDEAVSYGERSTIHLLLKTLRDQTTEGIVGRRQELIRSLQALGDFYAELKWEFHTWVPLLSRLLPSDVCRIYKTGSCIRLDSTLGDFREMKWSRGDVTFIFNGEDNRTGNTLSMVVLDNEKKEYQRMKLLGSDDDHGDLHDHVNYLMSRPIIYANMSTQPITVARAQSGWWFFKGPRSEQVGEYSTDVYDISNLILISRKRRESLTPEQIKEHEHLQKKLESGKLEEKDFEEEETEERETVHSLPPPAPTTLTWDEYIQAPVSNPRIGRPMDLKTDRKHFKASVWMAEECPIQLKQEIPVFPTVTAIVTLEKYEERITPTANFLVPRDYKKFVPKNKETDTPTDTPTTNAEH